jgi:hypothetical protein
LVAAVRFVNAIESAVLPQGIDVCVRPAGGAWLGGNSGIMNQYGQASELRVGVATRYVPLASGAYDVRIIKALLQPPTSPCDGSFSPLAEGELVVADGTRQTLVVAGTLAGGPELVVVDEQLSASSPSSLRLTFVSALAKVTAVDLGLGPLSGAGFTKVVGPVGPFLVKSGEVAAPMAAQTSLHVLRSDPPFQLLVKSAKLSDAAPGVSAGAAVTAVAFSDQLSGGARLVSCLQTKDDVEPGAAELRSSVCKVTPAPAP